MIIYGITNRRVLDTAQYTVAQTGAHVSVGAGLKGTPTFAGIHMHDVSAPPSRRDDLGALGYMLCHLLRGPGAPLPWASAGSEAAVVRAKKATSVRKLCAGHADAGTAAALDASVRRVRHLRDAAAGSRELHQLPSRL